MNDILATVPLLVYSWPIFCRSFTETATFYALFKI